MVLEVNQKYVLIFKGRVDALGEVEYPPYGDCLSTPTRPAGWLYHATVVLHGSPASTSSRIHCNAPCGGDKEGDFLECPRERCGETPNRKCRTPWDERLLHHHTLEG